MEHLRIVMTTLAFVVALLGVMFSARTAAAQDVRPTWAKWAFDLKADGDRLDAQWHITIGGEDNSGAPVALHTQTFQIPCRTVGAAKAADGVIELEGGYLECDFPDLIATANDIITNLWGKEHILLVGGDCECAPIRLGYATVTASPTVDGGNPVFHHPDIAVSIIRDKGNVRSFFRFAQEQSTGGAVAAGQSGALTSRYYCDPNTSTCFFEHLANGTTLNKEKRNFAPANFYTGAVTVSIGRNPQNGNVFRGTIGAIDVDPGCRVN